MNFCRWSHQITQHIRYGLTPLPLGKLLPSVATSYMLETLAGLFELFDFRQVFECVQAEDLQEFLCRPVEHRPA